MVANVESMMYVGEVPWHGKGKKLDNPATSAEAIKAAGLDWAVSLEPVRVSGKIVPGYNAVVRSDNGKVLSIMGNRYRAVQNEEAFNFFDSIVGEKAAMYHTAGVLGDGKRVWLLAKLPNTVEVVKDDIVEQYFLLTNTHDGTSPLHVLPTPIRVVCQNTLNAALYGRNKDNTVSVRHTRNAMSEDTIKEARRVLGIVMKYYDDFTSISKAMASFKVTEKVIEGFIDTMLPISSESDRPKRRQDARNSIRHLIEAGKGTDIEGVKGSMWGLYNAATEYADWLRPTRDTGEGKESNRITSLIYGSSAQFKQKAFDTAMALMS